MQYRLDSRNGVQWCQADVQFRARAFGAKFHSFTLKPKPDSLKGAGVSGSLSPVMLSGHCSRLEILKLDACEEETAHRRDRGWRLRWMDCIASARGRSSRHTD